MPEHPIDGTLAASSQRSEVVGAFLALGAAALFGVSAPLAKLLLRDVPPLLLSGLLYLGAGVGLTAGGILRRASDGDRETPLRWTDLRLLLGIAIIGGIVGPVLLLVGLQRVSAVTGSLLLNFETPLTILLAVVVFGDFIAWREAAATTLIVFGAFALSYTPDVPIAAQLFGILAVIAACLCWAIDNNLTQRLSLRDPVAVVRTKTWIAGSCSLALALLLGQQLPRASIVVESLLLGLTSYGMSLVLAVHAMRLLGAAREAAFFATAPFVGALAAVPLLGERLGLGQLLAMALMALGVGLLIRERHDHEHSHDVLEHEHAHVHDAHHEHTHSTSDPLGEPHAHAHVHAVMTHHHPHASDAHHRHRH